MLFDIENQIVKLRIKQGIQAGIINFHFAKHVALHRHVFRIC